MVSVYVTAISQLQSLFFKKKEIENFKYNRSGEL